jgi:hypothetical protein
MTNHAIFIDAEVAWFNSMTNSPFDLDATPCTYTPGSPPPCGVAKTKLVEERTADLTVTEVFPLATVATPLREKVVTPVKEVDPSTARAVPDSLLAKTPVPVADIPATAVPPSAVLSTPITPAAAGRPVAPAGPMEPSTP